MNYFTPKLEIKPQLTLSATGSDGNYFTPKLEIKPQLGNTSNFNLPDYFTPKLEIKPQHMQLQKIKEMIILHPN